MPEERVRMKFSESYQGLTVLFLGREDNVALCCFLSDQSGVSLFHEFCTSYSKANQEDMGAGEDFGLQSFSVTHFLFHWRCLRQRFDK